MTSDWVKSIALILLCAVLAGVAHGDTVFPVRTGRVVDEAGLLSQQARENLTQQLAEHERKTSNQVVVVTVRSLQGMRIEAYSLALANKWGVGQAGRNNGIVLLVAPNERQVRIEVGTGLERHLTNAIAADIIERRMLPAFRAGQPENAIKQGVDNILVALSDGYQIVPRPQWIPGVEPQPGDAGRFLVIILVFGAIVLVVLVKEMFGIGETNVGPRGRNTWRSDDTYSDRRSSFSDRSFSDHSSGGGGSFSGGGASGRW